MENYLNIKKRDIEKYFAIKKKQSRWHVTISNGAKPIFIEIPFVLDESIAKLARLIPDGCLTKNLNRIFFHQKKDPRKIKLFSTLITRLFSKNIIFWRRTRDDGTGIYVNSITLASFLYLLVGFSKAGEQMRIPSWIFNSPRKVKIAYLKQAFDMEGTILKKLTEIRFGTKDEKFALDIKKLLFVVGIQSYHTYTTRPKQTSGQHRVSIYRKENFEKFKEIGFQIPHLKQRFKLLLKKYAL